MSNYLKKKCKIYIKLFKKKYKIYVKLCRVRYKFYISLNPQSHTNLH